METRRRYWRKQEWKGGGHRNSGRHITQEPLRRCATWIAWLAFATIFSFGFFPISLSHFLSSYVRMHTSHAEFSNYRNLSVRCRFIGIGALFIILELPHFSQLILSHVFCSRFFSLFQKKLIEITYHLAIARSILSSCLFNVRLHSVKESLSSRFPVALGHTLEKSIITTQSHTRYKIESFASES